MVAPTVANLDWIRHIHLFLGLPDEELAWILARFQEYVYQEGDLILREGDPPEGMYFIREGAVEVFRGQRRLAVLERGDYFGEEALVLRRTGGRTASARALGVVRIYFLSLNDYFDLVAQFPQVKKFLRVVALSRRRARRRQPDWLAPNEWIYLYLGKHPARLVVDIWPGLLVLLLSGFLLWLAGVTDLTGLWVFAALSSVVGVGLSAWYIVDWANDEYIITNQRVVWIERVVMAYESRTEAPFRTILSLKVSTTFEGRMLGYGDVTIRTWFGSFALRYVGYAAQIEAIIKEYWQRTREHVRRAERQAILALLKERLGYTPPKRPSAASRAKSQGKPRRRRFSLIAFLRYWLSERVEDGEVITYRKHWLTLLRRLWWQAPLGSGLLVGGMLFVLRNQGLYAQPLGVVMITASLFLLGWAFYGLLDWANDVYRLTADQVIDIERKPWGSEQKQSAPLESIQSLDHTRRGIVGLLFNFGDVHIRAGAATLVFRNVHKPDRVLQDIYQRMEARRRIRAAAEAQRERERMAEWLEIYHQLVHGEEPPETGETRTLPSDSTTHQP